MYHALREIKAKLYKMMSIAMLMNNHQVKKASPEETSYYDLNE